LALDVMGQASHADPMTKVTCDLSISLDGYAAGLGQTEERPFGDDGGDGWGSELHGWFEDPAEQKWQMDRMAETKAFIMGRNMFGPVRGAWDRQWNGWWGDNPPYHGPVFVLTHHPREPQPMDGGTTFHFVTEGIEAALEQAKAAAGDKAINIAGGATAIQQYLAAGLLEELYLHIVPIVLGGGARLLENVGDPKLEPVEVVASPAVTHVRYRVGP
jgi:dihydrofolate reductase